MKRDVKYIIKRILIGVGIVLVMSFISSCNVKAETYNLNTNYVTFYTTGGGTPNGSLDTLYTNNNVQSYWAFKQVFELGNASQVIFPGQYLIEFYVYSNSSTLASRENCSLLTSNFENVNMTTGNWVSNEINSQCLNIYSTTYNGKNAYRILYKFTYKGARVGADGITEMAFYVSSSPNDWFYGNSYALASSNIYDYDIGIVEQFNQYKQNQTIINQNNTLNNSINNQTQTQHNDSINEQNAINNNTNAINDVNDSINDSSIPSDSSSKINNITDTIKANQNSSIVQIATFFPQTLQLILNGFNTSCTGGYSLGSLYGTELTIPCINPVDYLGSFLWGVIDSILCLCYLIPLCKFLVNKYNDLTSMKNLRWQ